MRPSLAKFAYTITLSSLFATGALAESTWSKDDSWKVSSPYYYGDSGPTTKDPYRRQTSQKRVQKKARTITPFSPDSHNLSLDLGQNFLVGSDYQDAIGFQGSYTYGVSDIFAFRSSVGYSRHSGGQYSKLNLLAGPRLNLSHFDRVIPYIHGGLGFYQASRDVNRTNSVSGTMFGMHAGAGADLQLTKEAYFGAGLAYHQLFGSNKETSIGPVDIASNFVTFMAHVGYTF